jgi:hypothetical protein
VSNKRSDDLFGDTLDRLDVPEMPRLRPSHFLGPRPPCGVKCVSCTSTLWYTNRSGPLTGWHCLICSGGARPIGDDWLIIDTGATEPPSDE